jgi:hypothetical protein
VSSAENASWQGEWVKRSAHSCGQYEKRGTCTNVVTKCSRGWKLEHCLACLSSNSIAVTMATILDTVLYLLRYFTAPHCIHLQATHPNPLTLRSRNLCASCYDFRVKYNIYKLLICASCYDFRVKYNIYKLLICASCYDSRIKYNIYKLLICASCYNFRVKYNIQITDLRIMLRF